MPEGPEVRITADLLTKWLVGRTLSKMIISDGLDQFRAEYEKMIKSGIKFTKVGCKGKLIYIEMTLNTTAHNQYLYMTNHMMLTGRWTDQKLPKQTPRCTIELADSDAPMVYFYDTRMFGKFAIMNAKSLKEKLAELGPDVMSAAFNELAFTDMVGRSGGKNVAMFISDQSIMSGIGNYLRSEVLYVARVSPFRKVGTLEQAELDVLYDTLKSVPKEVYNAGGTEKYIGTGAYQFKVYGQSYDPKGNPIESEKLGGQTIWYVPTVQKI